MKYNEMKKKYDYQNNPSSYEPRKRAGFVKKIGLTALLGTATLFGNSCASMYTEKFDFEKGETKKVLKPGWKWTIRIGGGIIVIGAVAGGGGGSGGGSGKTGPGHFPEDP